MKKMKSVHGILIVLFIVACLVVQPAFAGTTTNAVPGTAPAVTVTQMFRASSAYPVQPHSIVPEITEVGKISTSINALGINGDSGTLTIVKPPGATVRKAYMAAATTGFYSYSLAAGDIKIDGTPVTWDITFPSYINSNNYFTDVTSIVQSKIDSAPAGNVDFSIAEVNTESIDGEILAVIFDDPAQTTDNTVILLFGAQNDEGDDFNIGLAEPVDKTNSDLALDFSLGISYGYQTPALPNQVSIVEVNGNRLTSSAGGQDDGVPDAENGALITVGGVGDSNANPPDVNSAPVDGYRYDDELYSLLPFVENGDTTIRVHTQNPTNDDNIFFAALMLKSTTAVVGQGIVLSPASATNTLGESHTLMAKVQDDTGNPVIGKLVTFTITNGPNMGTTFAETTDANGEATAVYTSSTTGTDTIIASFVDDTGLTIESNKATKTWVTGDIPAPEFPTLALPIGMLLGIVFIITSLKSRKN